MSGNLVQAGDVPKFYGCGEDPLRKAADLSSIAMCQENTNTGWPHTARPLKIRGGLFPPPKGPVSDLSDPIDDIHNRLLIHGRADGIPSSQTSMVVRERSVA